MLYKIESIDEYNNIKDEEFGLLFSTSWCTHCRAIEKFLSDLNYDKKIYHVYDNQALFNHFNISSFPSFMYKKHDFINFTNKIKLPQILTEYENKSDNEKIFKTLNIILSDIVYNELYTKESIKKIQDIIDNKIDENTKYKYYLMVNIYSISIYDKYIATKLNNTQNYKELWDSYKITTISKKYLEGKDIKKFKNFVL